MKLVTIGTSAIDAECEIAKKELTVLHERCVASNQHHDLLVILGNMDIVTIDRATTTTITVHRGFDLSSCQFRIIDFRDLSAIDSMWHWCDKYPSHIIGYAYEREE